MHSNNYGILYAQNNKEAQEAEYVGNNYDKGS